MQYTGYHGTGVVCRSHNKGHSSGLRTLILQPWVQVEKGSAAMFGALRLECVLHATEHREELAGI